VPEFSLTGPRGDNPLGFLTALGTLVTLEDAGHLARLGWVGMQPRLVVEDGPSTREALIEILYTTLRREPGAGAAKIDEAKKDLKKAKASLNRANKGLKGLDREARARELEPFEIAVREKEAAFAKLLTTSGADASITLGRKLNVSNGKLLEFVSTASEQSRIAGRRWVDLAAAYGVADPVQPEKRMLATPWALVSGQQEFLGSVAELMIRCTRDHLNRALFGPWEPCDQKYSLRLDAAEDRRYALMARDPTASGNEPPTLWGANRLAFEALRCFPTMPVRGGMGVRAWRPARGNRQNGWSEDSRVRWPLWDEAIPMSVVLSLLGLTELWSNDVSARARLRGYGVRAVVESRRVAVRDYGNLTPALPVWIGPNRTTETH